MALAPPSNLGLYPARFEWPGNPLLWAHSTATRVQIYNLDHFVNLRTWTVTESGLMTFSSWVKTATKARRRPSAWFAMP